MASTYFGTSFDQELGPQKVHHRRVPSECGDVELGRRWERVEVEVALFERVCRLREPRLHHGHDANAERQQHEDSGHRRRPTARKSGRRVT
jgi:hypothetical protein